jgi:hypothetical protein
MIAEALDRASRAHHRADTYLYKAHCTKDETAADALRAKADQLRKRQWFEVHSLWFGQVNHTQLDLSDPDKAVLEINWGYTGAYDEAGRIEPDESETFTFEWPIWYFNMYGAREFRNIRKWLREIEK